MRHGQAPRRTRNKAQRQALAAGWHMRAFTLARRVMERVYEPIIRRSLPKFVYQRHQNDRECARRRKRLSPIMGEPIRSRLIITPGDKRW